MTPGEEAAVYTVSQIVGDIRARLEHRYPRIAIRGEITGLRPHSSGHLYFALKDRDSQLKAVMFRGAAAGLRFRPADGIEVVAHGEITVYEPQGAMQIRVRRLEPSGIGALMQAYERLKRRLAGEGLFDRARKRPLPAYPRTIGLVTSRSGAAVRDLVKILNRRWPAARIVLVPVRVQGEGAAVDVAEGLRRIGRWGQADVVIVGRGGGSLEDLWAFNEEPVVRAIVSCPIPVVSAVGHETDTTLADLAADLAAPTPSAAAEMVVPDRLQVEAAVRDRDRRLDAAVRRGVRSRKDRLERMVGAYGFRRPARFLRREQQRVDLLALRLDRSLRAALDRRRLRWERAARTLRFHHPGARLAQETTAVAGLNARLDRIVPARVAARRREVDATARALKALDPTAVLSRGYCLARDPETGRVLVRARGLDVGAPVLVQFSADRAMARIEAVEPGGPLEGEVSS